MKLSTYINAEHKAYEQSNYLFSIAMAQAMRIPKMPEPHKELRLKRQAQADKFRARAIQLADEQHDLIVVQAQLLKQFATAMEETTNGK